MVEANCLFGRWGVPNTFPWRTLAPEPRESLYYVFLAFHKLTGDSQTSKGALQQALSIKRRRNECHAKMGVPQ